MAKSNTTPLVFPSIVYESYLLRVRRVTQDGQEVHQVYLQDILSQEERYFKSLAETLDFLRAPKEGQLR